MKLEDAILTGAKDIATLQCLLINARVVLPSGEEWPQASLGFEVDGLDVRGEKEKVVGLKKFSFGINVSVYN